MHRILVVLAVLALLFTAHAEEKRKSPPKKTVPIAGGWLLTSEKQEKTKTEGTRTLRFTATGNPTLKRSSKVLRGTVDITASADRIECDFVGKKLILTGNPHFRQVDAKTGVFVKEITGEAETVIKIPLRFGAPGEVLEPIGKHKVTVFSQ